MTAPDNYRSIGKILKTTHISVTFDLHGTSAMNLILSSLSDNDKYFHFLQNSPQFHTAQICNMAMVHQSLQFNWLWLLSTHGSNIPSSVLHKIFKAVLNRGIRKNLNLQRHILFSYWKTDIDTWNFSSLGHFSIILKLCKKSLWIFKRN